MTSLSVTQRVEARLVRGATAAAIASAEGLSLALVEIVVDDLRRREALLPAASLCASGLGACGDGEPRPEILIQCAGCPLMPLRPRRA